MALQKRNHSDNSSAVKCDKCEAKAHGPENHKHRKCPQKANKEAGGAGTWRKE